MIRLSCYTLMPRGSYAACYMVVLCEWYSCNDKLSVKVGRGNLGC
jgi:hypothetical protein